MAVDRCLMAPAGIVLLVYLTGCLEAPHDPVAGAVDAASDSDSAVIAASCTVGDFSDDFTGNYSSVWTSSFEHQDGMLATEAGQGLITLSESANAWAGFLSPTIDLRGTCNYGEVIEVPNLAADSAAEAWFSLARDEDAIYFRLTRNRLTCNERIEGEVTSSVDLGAFDPLAHSWWRLRDEGDGTVACDVSPDGQAWTRLGGVAMTRDLSSAHIVWLAGTWEPMADPGVFRIDNVND